MLSLCLILYPDVGTRYREIVRMLPFFNGEILSEITHFEPDRRIDEDWRGPCMQGDLSYILQPTKGGTRLIQRERVKLCWILFLFTPIYKAMLGRALRKRLDDIKLVLETGWESGQ